VVKAGFMEHDSHVRMCASAAIKGTSEGKIF